MCFQFKKDDSQNFKGGLKVGVRLQPMGTRNKNIFRNTLVIKLPNLCGFLFPKKYFRFEAECCVRDCSGYPFCEE